MRIMIEAFEPVFIGAGVTIGLSPEETIKNLEAKLRTEEPMRFENLMGDVCSELQSALERNGSALFRLRRRL